MTRPDRPDILLKKDRIRLVAGKGNERDGSGRERGDLEVGVGEDQDASIRMNADWANLVLGGGAGKAPEGDIKLLDRSGTHRVQVTAESGNKNHPGDTRVWVDGGNGVLQLGDGGGVDSPTIDMRAGTTRGDPSGGPLSEIGLFGRFDRTHSYTNSAAKFLGVDLTDTAGVKIGTRGSPGGTEGALAVYSEGNPATIIGKGTLTVGHGDQSGEVKLFGEGSLNPVAKLDGAGLRLNTGGGNTSVELQSRNGKIVAGGNDESGELMLKHGNENLRMIVDKRKGGGAELRINGNNALTIGPTGKVYYDGNELGSS